MTTQPDLAQVPEPASDEEPQVFAVRHNRDASNRIGRVFEKYHRVPGIGEAGIGLKLPICPRIAQREVSGSQPASKYALAGY